jgi:hypothetical protein
MKYYYAGGLRIAMRVDGTLKYLLSDQPPLALRAASASYRGARSQMRRLACTLAQLC